MNPIDSNQTIVRARDVMSQQMVFIDGMATAQEAAQMMRDEKVDALLVNKRNANDAWGILSVQDLISGVVMEDRSAERVNVYEVMTKPVITVPTDMDVRYVVRLMIQAQIRHVLVTDGDQNAGLLSFNALILEKALF